MASTTDIAHVEDAARRVFRTVIAVGVPGFIGFTTVFPQILAASGIPVSSRLYLWLIAFAAILTAVAAGISRVLAIPAVNAFVAKIGAGAPVLATASTPAAVTSVVADPAVVVADPVSPAVAPVSVPVSDAPVESTIPNLGTPAPEPVIAQPAPAETAPMPADTVNVNLSATGTATPEQPVQDS